ncbi:hypothetical protein ACOMHN_035408 [Nucella lapillus]
MSTLLLLLCCWTYLLALATPWGGGGVARQNGLHSRIFKGSSAIQEIECSGSALDSAADGLLSTILYSVRDGRVLASANFATKNCLTTDTFSSCVIDARDSRRTRVRALVLDLKEEESREFGCNVTAYSSLGKALEFSWIVSVTRPRRVNYSASKGQAVSGWQ